MSLRRVKCEGRFSKFRDMLFGGAVELVLEDRIDVTRKDLEDVWDLIKDQDIHNSNLDFSDPYFPHINPRKVDEVRIKPPLDPISLVPMFTNEWQLSSELHRMYLESMGVNKARVLERLPYISERPRNITDDSHDIRGEDIIIEDQNLRGYVFDGGVGIGSLAPGGIKGGGIRSDSPYLIKVNHLPDKRSGERDLVSLIGFWAQGTEERGVEMLISQMQSCKNGQFPKNVPFGVANLSIAEKIAKELGFDTISCYTARNHPIFKEHPDNYDRLIKDFTQHWDSSAKKLGYNGGRCDLIHSKRID